MLQVPSTAWACALSGITGAAPAPATVLGGGRGCISAATATQRTQAAAPECSTPGTHAFALQARRKGLILKCCDKRCLFSQQVLHVDEALLFQSAQVEGVVNALPIAVTNFAFGGDQSFSLKRLDMRVDLPVVHADPLCDVSCGVAVRMLGQIPDYGRPQCVGIKHAQSLSGLLRQSREWLVDTGHPSILTHRDDCKKYQHIFDDDSITLKMMLLTLSTHRDTRKGRRQ